jgi:hypothetical protein
MNGLAFMVGAAALGGGVYLAYRYVHQIKYQAGDILAVWHEGSYDYITVLGQQGDQYRLLEGWYPDNLGAPYLWPVAEIDRDPSVQKIGQVEI